VQTDTEGEGKMTLPCNTCKAECCHSPGLTRSEYDAMKEKYPAVQFGELHIRGQNLYWMGEPAQRCPMLSKNRCTIYENRPQVCRNFGEMHALPCPKVSRGMAAPQGSPFRNPDKRSET